MKIRCSFSLSEVTAKGIAEAARRNGTSQSAIARVLLDLVQHVPGDMLRETSPLPAYFFGVRKGVDDGNE